MQLSCSAKNGSMASAPGIWKTTLQEILENLGMKVYHRKLTKCIAKDNYEENIRWAEKSTLPAWKNTKTFDPLKEVLHIGEKRFFICKMFQPYHKFDGKKEPEHFFNMRPK